MSSSDTARRFFKEVWTDGKLDLVDELFAPDYVGHSAGSEGPIQGPEGVKEYVGGLLAAFPDLGMTVEDQIADGDSVATRWTARGTHGGDLMGIEATGRTATVTGITIQRIRDGKIVAGWTNWDTLGLLGQLGVAPQPAPA